jgi:hypothetical protein
MFGTIKSLIPEPRQADQPRHYVGRHRQPDAVPRGGDAGTDPAATVDEAVAVGMEQQTA